MNYHVEHHLFPGVPYYNLPALHQEIKAYLPPPKPSMIAAYKEIVHALKMQRRDPTWELPEPYLPPGGMEPARRLQTNGLGTLEASGSTKPDSPGSPSALVDLGPTEGLVTGTVVRIDHGGSTYALYCLAKGDFALTDGLCTHAGTHLADGHLEGCIIECPKHNGRFDVRTGEATRRPATVPLQSYPVRVVRGRIIADLRGRRSGKADTVGSSQGPRT
jgi:MocE subfamily Rieske [2Fe-2S] domain protein